VTDDLRAAALVAQAGRLQHAAVTIRRQAGHLTYHPMVGRRAHAAPELLGALASVEQIVKEIQRAAGERAGDEVAAASSGQAGVEQVRLGHAAVDQAVTAVATALGVLRGALASPDSAVLDAPYGRGAPAGHHPGALCTMIAERVERLARALEVAAIVKANFGREGGSIAAQSGG
jgi:hypothetical protein